MTRVSLSLFAARSPKLGQALRKAAADGLSYLVLDGTLIPIDRVREDRPFYCCPHRAGHLAKAIHVLQIREAHAC